MLGDQLAKVLTEGGIAPQPALDVIEFVCAEGGQEANLAARRVASEGSLEAGLCFFLAQVVALEHGHGQPPSLLTLGERTDSPRDLNPASAEMALGAPPRAC